MIEKLRPYPAMKDSGVSWLGDVPEHWEVKRLRNVAGLRVSNVDKHSREGEEPVRLCNYVDVYKHDRITPDLPFMRATATTADVERFRLRVGDVLITKDSESWNDIGVPSLVECAADDLVSGYHLALLRPNRDRILGGFLFRALQSPTGAYQFHVEAKGVTRYGLSHGAIKSVFLPLPPVSEQAAIVRFIDYADLRIRRYIRTKQRLIKLLEEQKQALVHRAVTRGLERGVPLIDSEEEWLGKVPEHWKVRPAKWFFREVDERSMTGTEELLSVSHLTGVTPRSEKNVTMFKAESYVGHKICRPGDLVINTLWAWMGALGVSRAVGIVSPAYGVYRRRGRSPLEPAYAELLLRTKPYVGEYLCRSTGIRASRLRLYPDVFLRIPILCPPSEEQVRIVTYIRNKTEEMDVAVRLAQSEIQCLRELRTRLIADVVTGKLDVRDLAARLPEEDGDTVDQADDLDESDPALNDMDVDAELEEIEA